MTFNIKKLLISVLLSLAFLTGCATKKEQSFSEMSGALDLNKSTSAITYKGKTPQEVLQASHKVLYMLDPGLDMAFDISDNKLYAKRAWVVYLVVWSVIGIDQYNVTVEKVQDGTKSTFAFGSDSAPIIGPANSFKKNLEVGRSENPADFKLFHDRVEYFLGLRKDWVTCEVAKKAQKDPSRDMFLCDSVGLENVLPTDDALKNFM